MADAVTGADSAPITRHAGGSHLRRLGVLAVASLLAVTFMVAEAPAPTYGYRGTEAHRIVRIARSHIGAHFRLGTEGPRYFDCSGFIYRVYKQAGLLGRVGGHRRLAAGYYHWFKARGRVSRSHAKVGDLVLFKQHGKIVHSGIYLGHGRVISALINPWGVRATHIHTLHVRFFAFLHVRLQR